MATLGNNLTAGNTRTVLSAARAIRVPSFPANATINSLTARIADTSTATWQAGVWDGSGTLVHSGQVRSDITTNNTYVFTFAGESLTSGGDYHFGVCCNSASGATIYYADGSQTYEGAFATTETPNPLSNASFTADTTRDYAIEIDYTESGGDPEGSLIGGKLLRGGLLLHGVLTR